MSTTTVMTSTDQLRARARRSLDRCGVELGSVAGASLSARSPITGEDLFEVPAAGVADVQAAIAAAAGAFSSWRATPAPIRGALVKQLRRPARAAQGRCRRTGDDRSGQDSLRGARRGPGDDRHLRLRGRPFAPARRPHDALGATRSPADGDVASARRGRGHLGVQLSRWRCGPGTPRWRSFAATRSSGSRRR